MRTYKTFLLVASLAVSFGCSRAAVEGDSAPTSDGEGAASARQASAPTGDSNSTGAAEPQIKEASLTAVEGSNAAGPAAQGAPAPVERKIIRNATLTVEADAPADAMRRVASIAEAHGGYVVTSESRQEGAAGGDAAVEVVTVELRVPATRFDAALGEVRRAGSRVVEEKITGRDVTEEYIDLEARLRTQRALEGQLMEIMKRAAAVSDALQVQTQMASVRTEIERIEGRRRFLENQSSLSTIKVTLRAPSSFVATSRSGFLRSVKEAFGDGVDVAAALLLFFIRALIALAPVAVFVGLPAWLVVRALVHRNRRQARLAEELRQESAADSR